MNRTCPQCGAVAPEVADAFCPECRGPLDDEPEVVAPPATSPPAGGVVRTPLTKGPTRLNALEVVLCVFVPPIGLIVGIVYLILGRRTALHMLGLAALFFVLFTLLRLVLLAGAR
jgi:hypothetical protein